MQTQLFSKLTKYVPNLIFEVYNYIKFLIKCRKLSSTIQLSIVVIFHCRIAYSALSDKRLCIVISLLKSFTVPNQDLKLIKLSIFAEAGSGPVIAIVIVAIIIIVVIVVAVIARSQGMLCFAGKYHKIYCTYFYKIKLSQISQLNVA